jgi:hypothetical protein
MSRKKLQQQKTSYTGMSKYNKFLILLVLFWLSLYPIYHFKLLSYGVCGSLSMLCWSMLLITVNIRSVKTDEINIGGGACTKANSPKIYWSTIVFMTVFNIVYFMFVLINLIVAINY